jgi:hypothetical protein
LEVDENPDCSLYVFVRRRTLIPLKQQKLLKAVQNKPNSRIESCDNGTVLHAQTVVYSELGAISAV